LLYLQLLLLLNFFNRLTILTILIQLISKILKVLIIIIIIKLRLKLKDKIINRQQLQISVLTTILFRLFTNKIIALTKITCINNNIIAYICILRSYLLLFICFFVKSF